MTSAVEDVSYAPILSPELVLVDPCLAPSARALLPDPPSTVARMRRSAPRSRQASVLPSAEHGLGPSVELQTVVHARRRLMEGGVESEVFGSLPRATKHFRRRATLIPTSSAATAVVLLVLQLWIGEGTLQ
jgi:hypothetical protein